MYKVSWLFTCTEMVFSYTCYSENYFYWLFVYIMNRKIRNLGQIHSCKELNNKS